MIAGNQNNQGSLELYNPVENQWTLKSKTKAFHFYERFTAVPLDGTIYTFGETQCSNRKSDRKLNRKFCRLDKNSQSVKKHILGGQIYGGDYVKDIYKMGDDFNFSKIDQKLNERRSGHRSLVYENQVGFSS